MSTAEWAAVVAAGAAVVFTLTVVWLAIAVRRVLGNVQSEFVPLLQESRTVVETANSALSKSDELLGTANSVTETVDSASKLAYSVFSNPLIKGAALAAGIGRGVKSLRSRGRA